MHADPALRPGAAARPCRGGETLFVSDLHLSPEQPETTTLFLSFLARRAARADRLYILGDLFDAWIGDDDDSLPEVRDGLRALTASGTGCALMHGNRDFLLGRRFARATGCRLLRDPHRLTLGGEAVLLMHGDLLCTDDLAYQRFRRKVRNPLVQGLFLLKPLARRRQVAADYRRKSAQAMADKTADIMDANPDAVVRQMRRAGVQRLVHGHTHRPADHALLIDGHRCLRHVLADWHADHAEVLVHDADGWHREPVRER
jgi:UDP-2,3-diacylglucosamine hydrolase